MFFNKYIKYRDILVIVLIALVGYKLIDNYQMFLNLISTTISVISPFIYAMVFAYCINPIMNLFERRLKMRRGLSIFSTYLLIGGAIVIGSLYIVPSIVDSIISITSEIPGYMETVQGWINEALKNQNFYELINSTGLLDNISVISGNMSSIIIGILNGSVSSIVSITTNVVKIGFGFLISIYILLDKERFIIEVKTITYMIFKEERGTKIIGLVRTYHEMIGKYIGTKAIDSAIIGVLAFFGLMVIGAPYTPLLAIVVGVTNMIPYFGPFVGEVVGAAVGLFVSPAMAITIFIFLLALQQFDAWYLDPKLIGDKVGVKPFYIILAVTIGGGFFGPIGMLLASPTMATINIYYERKVNLFKAKNKNLMRRIDAREEDFYNDDKIDNKDNIDKEKTQ
ncbi:AI-2E family transporter [Clostridium paraputrificum]|uniref:AI-2E family transporter n=1 Tax=Clostridium paraputrificum TaxID=29363 RepID=UPI000665D318|nr:AI-2E family transporter [Clostridium paraputrificum]MDB2085541.1 AI-2E family transporter [Clostridium paraputrificum]MDB2098546.1 AI-2E family transporter [Clostridium paraputrificum]MDB2106866.1 AI-2E family transporter [Clostridium paraputrificum]MDB2113579.1 AI-2E family transporter [Clostridium paraputrificum]